MGQQTSTQSKSLSDASLLGLSAAEGRADVVALFLQKDPSLLAVLNSERCSVLHIAAQAGHANVMSLVIEVANRAASGGVDKAAQLINLQNVRGMTALMLACELGHDECARCLVSHGADVWLGDVAGRTCLHHAALRGHSACVKLLVNKYQTGLPAALFWSAPSLEQALSLEQAASEEDLSSLMPAEVAPPSRPPQEAETSDGGGAAAAPTKYVRSPSRRTLHVIAEEQDCNAEGAGSSGRTGGLELLRSLGTPHSSGIAGQPVPLSSRYANVQDKYGLAPLHCAAWGGWVDLARMLLAAGAQLCPQSHTDCYDQLIPCNAGCTPMHLAGLRGHLAVIQLLMAHHMGTPGAAEQLPDPRSLRDAYGQQPYGAAMARHQDHVAAALRMESVTKSGSDSDRHTARTSPRTSDSPPPLDQDHGASPANQGSPGQRGAAAPPKFFVCPLTGGVFEEPLVAADGLTYEGSAIRAWLEQGNTSSPVTHQPLESLSLLPNQVLVMAIQEWREATRGPSAMAGASRSA